MTMITSNQVMTVPIFDHSTPKVDTTNLASPEPEPITAAQPADSSAVAKLTDRPTAAIKSPTDGTLTFDDDSEIDFNTDTN